MRTVGDLFDATASHIWDTMTCHSNTAGYKVPNYQRNYDWSEEKIQRLLDDCLNGFYYLAQDKKADSFTFLGTLILVKEKEKESTFDGTSLSIVDGQQRITTLVLIMCSLIECISDERESIEGIPQQFQGWLRQETEFHLDCLFGCVVGEQSGRSERYPFPRIVRDEDCRGRGPIKSEYSSTIAKFLIAFSDYYRDNAAQFEFPSIKDSAGNQRFRSNYDSIKSIISRLSDVTAYDDWESDMLPATDFSKRGVKDLFEKLNYYKADAEKNKAIAFITKEKAGVDKLVRMLLFASYLTKCVVLTRVETDDVDSAFDIFDSLNTTGEPLTAIETLKPRVIQFEEKKAGFKGSDSEAAFGRIDKHLNDVFKEPDVRQRETKELLVSFALYLDGKKLQKELSPQRMWLRTNYEKLSDSDEKEKRRYIESLANLASFRRKYWDPKGIAQLVTSHQSQNLDSIQLCAAFIRAMNTSLALPLIARYWSSFRKDHDENNYLDALRAITAFLVLRRSATGTTAGIDSVFRALMEKPMLKGADPLCTGIHHSNKLMDVSDLKQVLRTSLAAKNIGITSKREWVDRVLEIPLAQHSKPLSRFLVLAAANHAVPDSKNAGLWTRYNVRPSGSNTYLKYSSWVDDKYRTVEHVAPDSNPGAGWDEAIYRSAYTKHTLGNLVLLPQQENSSVGNQPWPKKKLFYLAMSEKGKEDQEKVFKEAKKNGFEFTKRTEKLLRDGERLALLDAIRDVVEWDAQLIKARSRNIAELAWDAIDGWLY